MAKSQSKAPPPAVNSVFANLEEGEVIAFEFENGFPNSQIRRGRKVCGEDIMPYLVNDPGHPRGRVNNVIGLVDLLNEVFRLAGYELLFHEAYDEDGSLNQTVIGVENDTVKLTNETEKAYESVASVHYKVHRV